MKIAVLTLGCKVNECESRSLIAELKSLGADVTEEQTYADAYAVNTCSVTGEADRKSRQLARKCTRLNPDAKVYVIGCSSQNDPAPYKNRDSVVYIGGTAGKSEAVARILADHAAAPAVLGEAGLGELALGISLLLHGVREARPAVRREAQAEAPGHARRNLPPAHVFGGRRALGG